MTKKQMKKLFADFQKNINDLGKDENSTFDLKQENGTYIEGYMDALLEAKRITEHND